MYQRVFLIDGFKKEGKMYTAFQATQLQRVTQASQTSIAMPGQYLTFLLAGETYAIGILNIKEIIAYERLTEVPMMPAFIRGVINLRGRVVPVVDLLSRFGRGKTAPAKRTSIVIVEVAGCDESDNGKVTDIGIIVDAVNEVVEITVDMIEPAPSFGASIRPEFINGMAKQGSQFIVMLAVDTMLAVNEMVVLGQAILDGNGSESADLNRQIG
jgi:purine-binding chemotaxis protein CheW